MVMRNFYVIVHAETLRGDVERGKVLAVRAYAEIDRIRREEEHCEIIRFDDAFRLTEHLPQASDDLSILVAGANKWVCCAMQLYLLRKNGYVANFHQSGCYDIYGERPEHMFRDIHDARLVIPEFFWLASPKLPIRRDTTGHYHS